MTSVAQMAAWGAMGAALAADSGNTAWGYAGDAEDAVGGPPMDGSTEDHAWAAAAQGWAWATNTDGEQTEMPGVCADFAQEICPDSPAARLAQLAVDWVAGGRT